jgi:hypothetical protein
MSNFVATLDTLKPKQFGENGNLEYGKSHNIDISQFFFQLVRTSDMEQLERDLHDMLTKLYYDRKCEESNEKLLLLFKLVIQTRDLVNGKGERDLAYMQLLVWYNYYPKKVEQLFELFLRFDEKHSELTESTHQYGSWKDVKYFCNFVFKKTGNRFHPLIDYVLGLANNQLKRDYELFMDWSNDAGQSCPQLTLVGKWLPREKSKQFGWIHARLAYLYFPEFLATAKTEEQKFKAKLKCKIRYNKMLTTLNKHLDTTQIKQCDKRYSDINWNTVTSLTNRKQRLAFLNKTKKNEQRSADPDRIEGAKKFIEHVQASVKDKSKKVHGKRCNVYELVKDALSCGESGEEKLLINQMWNSNSENNGSLQNIIPMCDTSGSMECDEGKPLYSAIGLSLRVAEKNNTVFKNRVLTFDNNPQWIQIPEEMTFVDRVNYVKRSSWGMNTNFYKAASLILDAVLESEIEPSEVSNMVLAVFSDMQIDASLERGEDLNTVYENIVKKYHDAGMRSKYRVPFEPPHILFWNLRNTTGFPCLSSQENVTYLSGFSSSLLNLFCEKGVDELKKITPDLHLKELLDDKRYNVGYILN